MFAHVCLPIFGSDEGRRGRGEQRNSERCERKECDQEIREESRKEERRTEKKENSMASLSFPIYFISVKPHQQH